MRLSLALLCLLCCFSAAGETEAPSGQLLEQVAQRLGVGTSLQGHFTQEKYLVFLQEPFVSSGKFSIDRSAGLRWQVLEPLASLMVVDGSKVLLDGKQVDDHGVGQLMGLIMFGLMENRLDAVSDYFAVSGEVSERGWRLSLLPSSARLQSVLQHIELRGDEYLREIEIFERDDNRTVIALSSVRTDSADTSEAHAGASP